MCLTTAIIIAMVIVWHIFESMIIIAISFRKREEKEEQKMYGAICIFNYPKKNKSRFYMQNDQNSLAQLMREKISQPTNKMK